MSNDFPTMYDADPNDSSKMTAKSLPRTNYKDVTLLSCSYHSPPDSVHMDVEGKRVAFFFGSQTEFNTLSAAEGTFSEANKVLTGSQHYISFGNNSSGNNSIELGRVGNFNPTAWSGSKGFATDLDASIVYVYNGNR